jgi:hypothetical protein
MEGICRRREEGSFLWILDAGDGLAPPLLVIFVSFV